MNYCVHHFEILKINHVHDWQRNALKIPLQNDKVLKRYKRKQLYDWGVYEDETTFQIANKSIPNINCTNAPSQISNTQIQNMKYTILQSRWMVGMDMRTKASKSGPS